MTSTPISRPRFWIGPLLFTIAFVLYLVTLSRGAFPGDSARFIVQHTGLDPFPPLTHPVWGFFAWLLSAIPLGPLADRLNVFSALCGASAVWLLYVIMSGIKHDRTFEESMARFPGEDAQTLSGVFSACYLMVSLPFWLVSTRAHPLAFGIALLLLSFLLLLRFGAGGSPWMLYAAGVVYAVGLTEFPTFIAWSPLFALLAAYYFWRDKVPVRRLAGPVILAAIVCTSIFLLNAWRFCQSPAYDWQNFESGFQVFKIMLRAQWSGLRAGIPQVGWLIISLVSFIPWLVVLGGRLPGAAPSGRGAWYGTSILFAALFALAIGAAFNISIAPWQLTMPYIILATPAVVVAMWAGYVAGYWYVMIVKKSRSRRPAAEKVLEVGRWVYLAALVILMGIVAARNLPTVDGRAARGPTLFAESVVDRLAGRAWLISGGILDDNIVIAAREKGVTLTVISTTRGRSSAYGRYVASLFANPRLKSLAHIGLSPFITEWLSSDPDIRSKLASLTSPDAWFAGNSEPLPDQLLFRGVQQGEELDFDRLVAEEIAFLDGVGSVIRDHAANRNMAQRWNLWSVRHIGKVANNLAVYLEDRGRTDQAFDLYRRARVVDTNNLSALMNMNVLARKEDRPEREALDQELTAEIKRQTTRPNLWSLSQEFGYVRHPDVYAQRGWAWAMSGKPNMAVYDMKHALELSGETPDAQLALARLYMAQQETELSEAQYLSVLDKDPHNKKALLGMCRLATFKGDYDGARGFIAKLKEENVSAGVLRLEEAVVESAAGNVSEAEKLINQAVSEQSQNPRAWMVLAIVSLQANDQDRLQVALAKLNEARVLPPGIRLAAARMAMNQGDRKAARRHLEALLKAQPLNVQALELVLRIDTFDRQRDLAEEHAEQLVKADPKNAYGNLMMGVFMSMKESYPLAENYLRVSLESQRSDLALSQLAWLLAEKGALVEGAALAREAIGLLDANGSAWDTLGAIEMELGNIDEAEKAIRKALELKPGDADVILHMAELLEKKGMFNEALRLADGLLARPSELGKNDYEELRELVKRLRAGT